MGALIKHSRRSIRTGCETCGIVYTSGDESTYLYLAHDVDAHTSDYCKPCDTYGAWVLMNPDGSRHGCAYTGPAPTVKPVPVVKPVESAPKAPAPVIAPVPTNDAEKGLTEALRRLLGTPQIDRAEVERIAREVVGDIVFPTRTVVIRDAVSHTIEGNTHARLSDVITVLSAGEHVLMVGPAGTGKSTIAEQAAEALGLPSYSMSLSPQTPASQIVGYYTATGEYVRTLFREAYENGGVYHFDEFDNGHPSILALCNAALANGHMAFPDGMVKRHPDFRCVASANTYGRGATRAYVGRQAIDAATLDRFTVLTIEIDESLEDALCRAALDDADVVFQVLRFVRKIRRKVEELGLSIVISPRASVGMCRLLAAGFMWEDAIDARVRRGLSDDQWRKVSA